MARPRVFLSSTYYDMRVVRADLERFVHEQGYEPVMFEQGHIAYGTKETLEEDCYREISTCDILVNVIGGKFGTFLTEERSKGDQAIKDILLSNHPLFAALKNTVKIPHRVFFKNLAEMESLLDARKTKLISEEEWDSPEFREYLCEWFKTKKILKVMADLFDEDGDLRIIKPDEWNDSYVTLEDLPVKQEAEEEVPF